MQWSSYEKEVKVVAISCGSGGTGLDNARHAAFHHVATHPTHVLYLDRSIPNDTRRTIDVEQRIVTMGPISAEPVPWHPATNTKFVAYGLDVVQCR